VRQIVESFFWAWNGRAKKIMDFDEVSLKTKKAPYGAFFVLL
jgi:hypothetical protein